MVSYKDAIEAAIERQAEVVGLQEAVSMARQTPGLDVDEDGSVSSMSRPGKETLHALVKEYERVAGNLTVMLIARTLRDINADELDLPAFIEDKL